MTPIAGLVRICAGETPIAETRTALVTALPEANGQIVIPDSAVLPGALTPLNADESRLALRPGGAAVAWRAGEGLLGFDPALLDIEIDAGERREPPEERHRPAEMDRGRRLDRADDVLGLHGDR